MGKKILVTGVPGNVGSAVVNNLIEYGCEVRAAVYNIERARGEVDSNVQLVRLDFEDPTTYEPALEGINKIFLMRPPAISDMKKYMFPFIDKAKEMGVEHVVFLSLLGIEKNPIPPHYKVEKYLEKSGIDYTFLRPSFFMQNLSTTHRDDIKTEGNIFIPAGNAKVSFIDARDIGEVGAITLANKGHENKAYTLTGPEAITYYDVADIFTKELGRKVRYTNPNPLKFRNTMIRKGTPKAFANVMVGLYLTTRFGMAKLVTPQMEKILGRKPISVKQFIQDHIECW
ncbi:SDR family oxidoreductase [Alkalicella caledoniensis]|uniref:SDR family oxidoreductase n=1 Tax=Alkalicella caledoniensis TaxID=2731377 RepID=A0A7G9W5H9_ALKCA|nr:SDR family oxidoreductase [Alkalicella caledoniensis]QNO13941.1 SDR family oxidoreductase [Alkalicella caledoniensis]